MKKYIAMLLALIMCLALCACGGNNETVAEESAQEDVIEATPEATAEPTPESTPEPTPEPTPEIEEEEIDPLWREYQEYLITKAANAFPDVQEFIDKVNALTKWDDIDQTISPWDELFTTIGLSTWEDFQSGIVYEPSVNIQELKGYKQPTEGNKEVEITLDNWNEYFEIEEKIVWTDRLEYVIAAKQEYADKIDAGYVEFLFSNDVGFANYENNDGQIGDGQIGELVSVEIHGTTETEFSYNGTDNVFHESPIAFDDESGYWQVVVWYDNFEAIRVEGSIFLYE